MYTQCGTVDSTVYRVYVNLDFDTYEDAKAAFDKLDKIICEKYPYHKKDNKLTKTEKALKKVNKYNISFEKKGGIDATLEIHLDDKINKPKFQILIIYNDCVNAGIALKSMVPEQFKE